MFLALVLNVVVMSLSLRVHTATLSDPEPVLDCETARQRCTSRIGCSMALHSYMIGCSDIMSGLKLQCHDNCKKALIALASSREGDALMQCDCNGNDFCITAKRRIEVCRPEVTAATENNTIVSCTIATWICAADSVCKVALEYYHQYCESMFQGKKCTARCHNSLNILNKQEKAAKLKTCICDGTEEYDCLRIKKNMDLLCFGKPIPTERVAIKSSNDKLDRKAKTNKACSSAGHSSLAFKILVWTGFLYFAVSACLI